MIYGKEEISKKKEIVVTENFYRLISTSILKNFMSLLVIYNC